MNPETNRFEKLHELEDLIAEEVDAEDCEKRAKRLIGNEVDRKIRESRMQRAIRNAKKKHHRLVRPNGEPVPEHWTTFQLGELVVIKSYTFRVAYIGETSILFEPVGEADMVVTP